MFVTVKSYFTDVLKVLPSNACLIIHANEMNQNFIRIFLAARNMPDILEKLALDDLFTHTHKHVFRHTASLSLHLYSTESFLIPNGLIFLLAQ